MVSAVQSVFFTLGAMNIIFCIVHSTIIKKRIQLPLGDLLRPPSTYKKAKGFHHHHRVKTIKKASCRKEVTHI